MKKIILSVLCFFLCSITVWSKGSQEETQMELTEAQTIQVWYSLGGAYSAPLEEIIKKFNESQSMITVEGSYQGNYGTTQEKLIAAYIAGNPPILSQLEQSLVGFFVVNDALVTLEDFIEADTEFDRDDFDQYILRGGTYDDKLYGLPINVSTPVLYINRDLFRNNGLDPDRNPEDWDDVYQFSQKISDPANQIYGFREYNSGWITHSLIKQFGGDLFSQDETRVTWNSKEGKAAFELWKKMLDEKLAVFQVGSEGSQMDASGMIGMVARSTGSIQWYHNNVETYDWGVAPFAIGKKAVSLGGGNIYMLKRTTRQQQLAGWEFLKFLTNTENLKFWSLSTGYMAARKSAQQSEEFQKMWANDPRYAVTYKQLPYSFPRPKVENWPEINDLIGEAVTKMLAEGAATDALDEAAQKAQELLE